MSQLQHRAHCYPRLRASSSCFYAGRIVRIQAAVRVGDRQLFHVRFGNVDFYVRAEEISHA